ncbi:MAG: polyphenol oxidase family protein [Nannocystaceae bacterium]
MTVAASVLLLRATTLPAGVFHGFSTRSGGVSKGGFASLNLGTKWGDDPDAVAENWSRVGLEGGFAPGQLVRARQVHGAEVVQAAAVRDDTEADALWMRRCDAESGALAAIGVMTADCVPLLLATADATVVAAVHSGWRGAASNIAGRTVQRLREEAAVDVSTLFAAVGPCIEQLAFEVGEEVAGRFDAAHLHLLPGGRPRLDLVAVVRGQLVRAGLPESHIERVGGCTHADARRFFSYRRDGAGTGQHVAFIGFRNDKKTTR